MRQGASNVQHAISIATENNDDASVGLLLAHYVQDSKETGSEDCAVMCVHITS